MTRGPLDGAANNAAGLRWQRADAVYLRDHGWPLAASARRGIDLVAGPVGVDSTIIEWDKIAAKLDRHMGMCEAAGLPYAAVWKKRRGFTSPARGLVTVQANQFFGLVGELEAAQARAAAAEADLRRWLERVS